jgi:teichuronic acid biosynthesis glycosyltransferase TuaG
MEKVSVIIPVYNNSKYIKECIDSVINQTYKNLEILIINDGSTDDSLNIIKSYNDKRIIIINFKKNKGAAVARNEGIKKSTGRFITFIDADDYWNINKIEKQVEFIKRNKYQFIYSNYIYVKGNKTHIAKTPKSLTYNQVLKNTAIFTSTVMFDMNYFNKKDIYMEDIRMGQDAATWFRILRTKNITAYGMNEELSYYRVGNLSLSHNKFKAARRTWNLYKRENIILIKRIYYFICYACNAIKRRII